MGEKGIAGVDGDIGPRGMPGPQVRVTCVWCGHVWRTYVYVHCQGKVGRPGLKGETGLPGEIGSTGLKVAMCLKSN